MEVSCGHTSLCPRRDDLRRSRGRLAVQPGQRACTPGRPSGPGPGGSLVLPASGPRDLLACMFRSLLGTAVTPAAPGSPQPSPSQKVTSVPVASEPPGRPPPWEGRRVSAGPAPGPPTCARELPGGCGAGPGVAPPAEGPRERASGRCPRATCGSCVPAPRAPAPAAPATCWRRRGGGAAGEGARGPAGPPRPARWRQRPPPPRPGPPAGPFPGPVPRPRDCSREGARARALPRSRAQSCERPCPPPPAGDTGTRVPASWQGARRGALAAGSPAPAVVLGVALGVAAAGRGRERSVQLFPGGQEPPASPARHRHRGAAP